MGCVSNKNQIRLDSTVFQISRTIRVESTKDLEQIGVNEQLDESNSFDYLTIKSNKNNALISSVVDPTILSFISDKKANEHYKIIKPFFKKTCSKKETSPQYFLVRHIQTKHTYLMKVKRKNIFPPNNNFLLNFEQTFKNLRHPNLMKYHEVFRDMTNYYIISEHPNEFNSTLNDEIKKNKNFFTENKIKEIMKQLLSGLLHLHSCDVIHRNISLDNILVHLDKKKLKIKIFNLEQSINAKENAQKNVNVFEKIGSTYYMPPEALKNNYFTKSDIWSAGVLMYMLLYGDFPFNGDNLDEIFSKIEKGRLILNEDISLNARNLLSKMLLFSPNNRYSAFQCLQHPWFNEEIIPKSKNGLGALIKSSIIIIMRMIYHKNDFNGLKVLYNELSKKYNKVTKSSIYHYLCESVSGNIRDERHDALSYESFCECLLCSDLLLSNSNISFVFDFIDKDTDNLLTANDFELLFNYVFCKNEENEHPNSGYYLQTIEHKSIVFPEFKNYLTNYWEFVDYL